MVGNTAGDTGGALHLTGGVGTLTLSNRSVVARNSAGGEHAAGEAGGRGRLVRPPLTLTHVHVTPLLFPLGRVTHNPRSPHTHNYGARPHPPRPLLYLLDVGASYL